MDQFGGVIGEKLVGPAGELGVMPQVGPGLVGGHRRHRVSDADPLVQGGEHAKPHAGPQLGLAEEQDGQRAGGVELGAGQHPDRLQLVMGQQVRLIDQQDRQPASLGELGGQVLGGLRDQGGVVEAGNPAEGGDDRVVNASRADLGVGDGDELVARGVQAGGGGARATVLPAPTRQATDCNISAGRCRARYV